MTSDANPPGTLAVTSGSREATLWPRAQSASPSLASLLFASGRPDQAYQLVAEAYREPTVMDPFREYGFGQHRRVDGVMTELRQEIWR